MLFWIAAAVITVLVTVWIVYPLLRGKKAEVLRSTYDVQIYKDQLNELDTDLERGTLTEAEYKAAKTEVSRRLLAADEAALHEKLSQNAPAGLTRALLVAVLAVVLAGSAGLYFKVGAPGMPDMPIQLRMEQRMTQAEAEAAVAQANAATDNLPDINQPDPKHLELVRQLEEVLKDRPDDLFGHRMLADNLAQLGKYAEARKATDKVMEILGEDATADDYAAWAEIMIVAADYYVSPEAEAALAKAVEMDANNPRARYYAGILMWQRGEPKKTYQIWDALLQDSAPDDPWVPVIEAQINDVAAAAGIARGTTRGPTAADMAAAGDMTPEERMAFIQDRVNSLSDRLATEGGTPAEWAQLIGSLGVLGDLEQARAVWDEAKGVFADDQAALDALAQAAQRAGIAN